MICQKISPLTLNSLDTSIFSTVKNVDLSTDQLNSDLEKISNWTHQWKMSCNPDPIKQAQKLYFFLEKE